MLMQNHSGLDRVALGTASLPAQPPGAVFTNHTAALLVSHTDAVKKKNHTAALKKKNHTAAVLVSHTAAV